MRDQIYSPNQDYKVLVFCATYNQSKYIEDTLNGFAMQKTNFPYVCLVMDDCSTEGEQDVIISWLKSNCDIAKAQYVELEDSNVILVYHKENENCSFAIYLLKRNLRGKPLKQLLISPWRQRCKYEALCEGDDYWTDAYKLQFQYDFLESHPDYVFCCHRFKIYEQNRSRYLKEYGYNYYRDNENLEITVEIMTKTWVTQILTTMYRIEADRIVEESLKKYTAPRDWHYFYYWLKVGKGISLNREMGVYRWNNGGIASSLSGYDRFKTQADIMIEIYKYHSDDTYIRNKVRYNIIRKLRFMTPKYSNMAELKEALSYCDSYQQYANAIISYFTPSWIIEILSNNYRKRLLDKTEYK